MITKQHETNERVILIAGVNGDIGHEFVRKLGSHGKVYGVSRGQKRTDADYVHLRANLNSRDEVREVFKQIGPAQEVIYIHLPGKFRFEDPNHPITDQNGDGIDDETYDTNVQTFKSVRPLLLDYLESNPSCKLKIVGIGSASDIYDLPFWKSFTYSKNELRKEFRLMYGYPKTHGRVSALFVNVSTVDGTQLAGERPFISREFCLSPSEVVDQSLPYILDQRPSFLEMSVIKPNPAFMDTTYLSPDEVRMRWYRDMYGPTHDHLLKGGKMSND